MALLDHFLYVIITFVFWNICAILTSVLGIFFCENDLGFMNKKKLKRGNSFMFPVSLKYFRTRKIFYAYIFNYKKCFLFSYIEAYFMRKKYEGIPINLNYL